VPEYVVGSVDELPIGSKRIVKAAGVEIGVFNVRGSYYALPNHCFHQGGPLCEGNVGGTILADPAADWKPAFAHEGEILVCPWHGLEFNITTGRCLARKGARLRRYRVKVEDGQVKVVV
jgi:nitrite reductase/ring-hydroxylating ferredoxin subunit